MKKQSDLSRLMGYAGKYRYFTYASWVLAAISALVGLLPFLYIWMIIREALDVMPDFSQAVGLVHNGIMAMVFAVVAFLIYIVLTFALNLEKMRNMGLKKINSI